jgi:hypothetical protein
LTIKPHRENAEAARSAAAASELPNVRERNLRSARAHDAVASQDEDAAANLKVRQAETAARRIGRVAEAFDEDED